MSKYTEARKALMAENISLRRKADWDEYRVCDLNIKNDERREACAYYTNDLDDAIATGWSMAKDRDRG